MKTHTPARRWTRHHHPSPEAVGEAERLTNLARALEESLAADEPGAPTLVVAIDEGDTVEVRLRALDHHPSLELEGLVAPPTWWCLGVVAGANAQALDPWPGGLDDDRPDRYRVHLAHLMTRSGMVARVLRDRRTDTVAVDAAAPVAVAPTESGGLLDDLLRRALGLPTAPPAHDTTELFAALWIHQVMVDAAGLDLVGTTWADVAARHPVLSTPLEHGDPALVGWATDHLVRAGELLAVAHPWARVRAACRDGVGPLTGTPADLAGWLDDGAFARMVMARFGPLHDLVVDLHELLPHDVYEQLVETVSAWGLVEPT